MADYQMILAPRLGEYELTLPEDMSAAPITVMPSEHQIINVISDNGKRLAVLKPGQKTTFEVVNPPKWKFWAKPQWQTAPQSLSER